MSEFDPVEFGKSIGAMLREAVEPLKAEIAGLKLELAEVRAVKGEPGPKGDPGEPVLVADVVAELVKTDVLAPVLDVYAAEAVAKHFEEHPVQHGKDAQPVTDEQIAGIVRKHLESNPPKDGKSVTVEDIAIFMEAAVSKWALDFERRASDTLAKTLDKIPEPKNGKDGLSMEQVSRQYDADAHEVVERWSVAGEAKELRYPAGGLRPGGFWREGMKSLACQAVTHDGALWIAKRDNTSKPCLENKDDWQIAARKGRDGQDRKVAPSPPPGPVRLSDA